MTARPSTRLTKGEVNALLDAVNLAIAGGVDSSMYESDAEYERVTDAMVSARDKLLERLYG